MVLDLVYPANIYCLCCKKPIDSHYPYSLCPSCIRMIHWFSAREETKEDLRALCCEGQYVCAGYGLVEKALIHDLKYKDKSYIASYLGELMYERVEVSGMAFDAVVPVPMYKRKERRRGYNQAALLAIELSKRMEVPIYPHLLIRTKDTPPMSNLKGKMRKENVRGVFTVAEWVQNTIYDKDILLVDDIITTGSTADACALQLKEAGARRVYILTFAGASLSKI